MSFTLKAEDSNWSSTDQMGGKSKAEVEVDEHQGAQWGKSITINSNICFEF